MDREALFEHYSRMPEELFTYFATHEVAGLPPEAVEILRQVMTARGTVPDPDAVIDIQCRQLSSEEFERMVTRFRQEPCPLCGASGGLLNGTLVDRAGRSEPVVGCRSCLEKELKSANRASVGFAVFVKASSGIRSIGHNDAALRELDSANPTQALREHVWLNRGELAHFLK
jgi:hypothetical protein